MFFPVRKAIIQHFGDRTEARKKLYIAKPVLRNVSHFFALLATDRLINAIGHRQGTTPSFISKTDRKQTATGISVGNASSVDQLHQPCYTRMHEHWAGGHLTASVRRDILNRVAEPRFVRLDWTQSDLIRRLIHRITLAVWNSTVFSMIVHCQTDLSETVTCVSGCLNKIFAFDKVSY